MDRRKAFLGCLLITTALVAPASAHARGCDWGDDDKINTIAQNQSIEVVKGFVGGFAAGAVVGAVVPGVGSVIGGFIGGAIGAFSGLRRGSEPALDFIDRGMSGMEIR